ncbi:MAG: IPTL-CTERM sorting domain-containing protein [Aliidongia sp.]
MLAGLGVGVILALAHGNTAWAQTAPDLGAAGTFGLVASTFTNTNAATTVNGDACFTTGPGTAYTVNGTQTVPCSAPVGTGQNSALATINGEACTSLGAGAVTLDTVVVGLNPAGTIPPGCYSSGGAMNITTLATVTLSGNGVYIFKAGGPLGIGASSAVNVTNGAAAANVYWAPVAATTFGASATFVGTIIDAAGITFGHLASLSGRALVFGGTITADANTISLPPPSPPLPGGPVPTLSEWAMIPFIGLLAFAAFAAMRKRGPAVKRH